MSNQLTGVKELGEICRQWRIDRYAELNRTVSELEKSLNKLKNESAKYRGKFDADSLTNAARINNEITFQLQAQTTARNELQRRYDSEREDVAEFLRTVPKTAYDAANVDGYNQYGKQALELLKQANSLFQKQVDSATDAAKAIRDAEAEASGSTGYVGISMGGKAAVNAYRTVQAAIDDMEKWVKQSTQD